MTADVGDSTSMPTNSMERRTPDMEEGVVFMTMIDDNNVEMVGADGDMHRVALDAQGVLAYQQQALPAMLATR